MKTRKVINICGVVILLFGAVSTAKAQYTFLTTPIGLASNTSSTTDLQAFELRLDLITESQIDELLTIKSVSFDQICDIVMGCNTRDGNVIVNTDEVIRIFKDDRLSKTKLIKLESSGEITTLSDTDNSPNELFLKTPEVITRSNMKSYSIIFEQTKP